MCVREDSARGKGRGSSGNGNSGGGIALVPFPRLCFDMALGVVVCGVAVVWEVRSRIFG